MPLDEWSAGVGNPPKVEAAVARCCLWGKCAQVSSAGAAWLTARMISNVAKGALIGRVDDVRSRAAPFVGGSRAWHYVRHG